MIREIAKLNGEGYKETMNKYLHDPKAVEVVAGQAAPPGGAPIVPFDIALHLLFWCLIVGSMCALTTGIGCTVVFSMSYPFTTLKCFYWWLRLYFSESCSGNDGCCLQVAWRMVLLVPWLIVGALIVPVSVLVWAVACVGSFIYGASGMFVCYENSTEQHSVLEGAAAAFRDSANTWKEAGELVKGFLKDV